MQQRFSCRAWDQDCQLTIANQADQNVLVLSINIGAFLLFMFLFQKYPPEDQETRQVN